MLLFYKLFFFFSLNLSKCDSQFVYMPFFLHVKLNELLKSTCSCKEFWNLNNSFFYHFRKIDDDQGKTVELAQTAVKCMRGILFCWFRQADKVTQYHNLHFCKDSYLKKKWKMFVSVQQRHEEKVHYKKKFIYI